MVRWYFVFFFKQKTAYEMRISDWSSDVCSSDLLDQASQMMGFSSFFDNFLTIAVLLIAWVIVIIAFFILSVQLFITIIEFKLTTLAGFVLVPDRKSVV